MLLPHSVHCVTLNKLDGHTVDHEGTVETDFLGKSVLLSRRPTEMGRSAARFGANRPGALTGSGMRV